MTAWRKTVFGTACGAAAVAALTLGAPSARADGAASTSPFEVNILPYLWITGLSGSVTAANGRSESFHQSFDNIVGHANAGLMMVTTLRYERWVALIDFDYINLSAKSSVDNRFLGQTSLSATNYLATVVGGYRVIDLPRGTLDLMAGTRIMSVNGTVNFSGALLPGFSISAGDTWADPIVATRAIVPVTPHLALFGYGDVGGGPNDDLTWQVYAGLNYSITHALTAYAGYRYLSIRHDINSFDLTEQEQGPMLGLGYRF